MYAPVQALAPPRTHRLLDGQVNKIDMTLRTDYGPYFNNRCLAARKIDRMQVNAALRSLLPYAAVSAGA
jgi:hypothetical protein